MLQELKQRAEQLTADIPAIFLALTRRETPWYAKILALSTVFYALSPIDLIPDFIPVIGYLDDLIILPILVGLTVKMIPAEVLEECREDSRGLLKSGMTRHWYFAVPIVLFWLIVIAVILAVAFTHR